MATASDVSSPEMLHNLLMMNRLLLTNNIVSCLVGAFLTGCVVLQGVKLCLEKEALKSHKWFAGLSTAICFLLMVLEMHSITRAALSFVDPNNMVHFHQWAVLPMPSLSTALACVSQWYFTTVCASLQSRYSKVIISISVFLMVIIIIGCVFTTQSVIYHYHHGLSPNIMPISAIDQAFYWGGLSATMILDVGLSVLIYLSLRAIKKESSIARTQSLLDNIMVFTLESYSIIAAASITQLILSILGYVLPAPVKYNAGGAWFALQGIVGRLYALSLLFTVDRRLKHRSKLGGVIITPNVNSSAHPGPSPPITVQQQHIVRKSTMESVSDTVNEGSPQSVSVGELTIIQYIDGKRVSTQTGEALA